MFQPPITNRKEAKIQALREIKQKIQQGKIFEISDRVLKFYEKHKESHYNDGMKTINKILKKKC